MHFSPIISPVFVSDHASMLYSVCASVCEKEKVNKLSLDKYHLKVVYIEKGGEIQQEL